MFLPWRNCVSQDPQATGNVLTLLSDMASVGLECDMKEEQ